MRLPQCSEIVCSGVRNARTEPCQHHGQLCVIQRNGTITCGWKAVRLTWLYLNNFGKLTEKTVTNVCRPVPLRNGGADCCKTGGLDSADGRSSRLHPSALTIQLPNDCHTPRLYLTKPKISFFCFSGLCQFEQPLAKKPSNFSP